MAQTSPAGEAKRDRPGDGLARARSLLREAGVKASLLEGVAEQSRTAARRARAAADAGDSRHAGLLERLKQRWARVALRLAKAVVAETGAKKKAEALAALEGKVARAQTLLSEKQARLGRLRQQVVRAEKDFDAKQKGAPGRPKEKR